METENNRNFLEMDKPQVEIMGLISECYHYLAETQRLMAEQTKAKNWDKLVDVYNDLLNRTDEIVPKISQYYIHSQKYKPSTLEIIRNYLHQLKLRGLYGVGKDEVIFWKIGSQ